MPNQTLYVNLAFVGQMLEDLRTILEILGPGLSLIAIAIFMLQRAYAGMVNLQLKRLEAQQQKDKTEAEIKLLQAKTEAELKLADQKADAEVTTRRDRMLEELIKISSKFSDSSVVTNQILGNSTEILRIVQTQQANILNQLSSGRDTDEAYQARMSIAALQIQEHSQISRSIIETLPEKLDGGFERAMERLNAIGLTLDTQHSAIKADIAQVVIEIAKVAQSKPEPGIGVEAGESKEPAAPTQDSGVAQ